MRCSIRGKHNTNRCIVSVALLQLHKLHISFIHVVVMVLLYYNDCDGTIYAN